MHHTIARSLWTGFALFVVCSQAAATIGRIELPATSEEGPVAVFYPTASGPAEPNVLADAPFTPGNGRLVVVSHGSGGSARGHLDLIRALVAAGFVVAAPTHRGDSFGDSSGPGPASWTIRPREVSKAIDAVGRDPRFGPRLAMDRVGLYGMSAGGHTALSLAGGQWSPASFVRHCEAHLAEDFQTCVGLATHLTGGVFDGLRKSIAITILRWRFADETLRSDRDPRIAAIVAAVPLAADFVPQSLEHPRVPLALITADADRWLIPRFHGDHVLAICKTCEHLVELPDGGHGALLSPFPRGLDGLEGNLLNDPPGFDRESATRLIDGHVVDFFERQLGPGRS